GRVVKGVRFQQHQDVGDILELAHDYSAQGIDELVFYDIGASPENRQVAAHWVEKIAQQINIPFCVAGGIRSVSQAEQILAFGADKISINTPALEQPHLITELAQRFGSQCVVVGIDSVKETDGFWRVRSYTGDASKTRAHALQTLDWIQQVQERGAGEIVLNCMGSDGTRDGFDLEQLSQAREQCTVPLIASGGAGSMQHFADVFQQCDVDGALAASVFHNKILGISELKIYLKQQQIAVR
ncbi:MAG: imidazole glycerol phosphate synthase subunit HisF, partial [Arenimonas sp.]|nr:imidazole glycerol phosphate synthase subunit HisF [Arenimonas sp.]